MTQSVVLLSYFFPPCNLPAAHRVGSWARYLPEFGFRPVVVTRNWAHEVRSAADVVRPGGRALIHDAGDLFDAYYLPHHGSWRDRLYARLSGTPAQHVTKPLTLAELLGQNLVDRLTPFRYLRDFLRGYLRDHPEVRLLVASGSPFVLFKFADELQREFPRLRWIADYRDDWTTNTITRGRGPLRRIVRALEQHSERRWLKSAAAVTTVSPHLAETIGAFVDRPAHVVYNGFELGDVGEVAQDRGVFRIVYNGTLYPTQPVEGLVEAVTAVARRHPALQIRVTFAGLEFDAAQTARVRSLFAGHADLLETTQRIPHADVLRLQLRSHALVILTHPGARGIVPSKLFEYIGLRRPVIAYPNDGDVIAQLMHESGAGTVCDNVRTLDGRLEELVDEFQRTGRTTAGSDVRQVARYSRREQTSRLAQLLTALS